MAKAPTGAVRANSEASTRLSAHPESSAETTGTRLVRQGFLPGARVGDWVLERRIGHGGMADVWRATSVRDGRRVALKRMSPALVSSSACRALFLEEARLAMRLEHPNLVRCLDVGDHDDQPFMLLELVEGPSCAELLSVAAARRERIPLGAVVHVAVETLSGLAYLHALSDEAGRPLSAVHRDVSPGNVLLTRGGAVRLADFGIAQLGRPRSSKPSVLQGKRGYLAPEQIAGDPVNLRADLFALAVLVVELATGRPPYDSGSELELLLDGYHGRISGREALPPALACVIARALSQRPSERFGSAAGMARALVAAARSDGIELGPERLDACLARNGFRREPDSGGDLPLRRCGAAASPVPEPAVARPRVVESVSRSAAVAAERARLVASGRAPAKDLGAPAASVEYAFGTCPNPAWRVSLVPRLMPEILLGLARGRATGLLVARAAEREKRIYLEAGLPSFVASTDENELFGARLVADGVVTPAQVVAAVVRAEATGVRMGTAMVNLGLVRPIVVVRALVAQLVERYTELLSWRRGVVSYCPGVFRPAPVLGLHLAPESVLARARRSDFRGNEASGVFTRESALVKSPNSRRKVG